MKAVAAWIVFGTLLLAAPFASAAEPQSRSEAVSGGVSWQALSDDQRKLLANFESRWDQLPLARQNALANG